MKKTLRRIILLALCLVVMSPIGVYAEKIDINDTDLSLDIDESRWYIFSRDNILDNEELTYLDIEYDYMSNYMQTEDVYLDCIVFFGDREHYIELLVKKTPNESVNNYANFDRKELLELAKPIATELGTDEYEIYENNYKYIVFTYEKDGLYCYDYLTVVNGENYVITTQKPFPYEATDLDFIKPIVDSAAYTINQQMLDESVAEEPEKGLPLIAIVGIAVGSVLLVIGVIGFAKWRKKSSFSKKMSELYETISINSRSSVFAGGKKEFYFVGNMLNQLFPKDDLKDLFIKYVNLHKTYTNFGGDVYKAFHYAKEEFRDFDEKDIYSLVALVILNIEGIKRYDDCSIERIEPFRRNANAKVKCVETIADNEEIFGVKAGKRLGARDNAILVAGASGINTYLDSLVAEDGTELEYIHKSTVYLRDKDLDIEYDLRNYSLRDASTDAEICSIWFNPYGVDDCKECVDGFVFEEDVSSGKISLVSVKTNDNVAELKTPTNVVVNNIVSSGIPKVTWNAVENADKYFIYRSLNKEGIYTYQGSSSGTEYVNSSAIAGNCYFYKVKAVDTTNQHAQSQESDSCYVTCDLEQPVVDIELYVGKPRISWNAVAGASKYEIYRKVGENGTYGKYHTTTSTYMTNTSAEPGKTYYYKVVAVCPISSYGNSAYSNEVSIMVDPF